MYINVACPPNFIAVPSIPAIYTITIGSPALIHAATIASPNGAIFQPSFAPNPTIEIINVNMYTQIFCTVNILAIAPL